MNYKEFKVAYTEAFNNSMKYSPNEVGSTLYTNKMVDLADDYPEFLEKLENELDENEKKYTKKDMLDFGFKCSPKMAGDKEAREQVETIFDNFYD